MARFAISGQHYLFDVQSFASVVLSLGGDAYDYALRDRTTRDVIADVASGRSELGVLVETTTTKDELEKAFREAGVEFTELIRSSPRVALPATHPLVNARSLTLDALDDYPYLYFEQGATERVAVSCRASRIRVCMCMAASCPCQDMPPGNPAGGHDGNER